MDEAGHQIITIVSHDAVYVVIMTEIMPHDSSGTLVFWHQSSLWNSNGITPYGGD